MTKATLAKSITNKVGFSKKESAELVELCFETIKGILESGKKVKISSFGNFTVADKKKRMGRNPQNGQAIEIPARRVVGFRPSQLLKAALNKTPR